MKHVLISGGTGLVGRYIVEECLAAGMKVTVGGRHRPEPGLFAGPVGFRHLDLDPKADRSGLFDGIDIFVHAAFQHVPGRYRGGEGEDPQGFVRLNLAGSITLFEAAKAAGVQRCIFLSSRAVYDGYPPGSTLVETLDLAPSSLYGKVKWQAEQALSAMAQPGFIPVSLRPTGVYGDLRPNKWDRLFERYLAGETIAPRAASEVHGRDLARAVLNLTGAPVYKVSAKVFNVTDIITDNNAILLPLKVASGSVHPLPERADHTDVSVMTTSRLNSLGWRSGGIPLFEDTVSRLAQDYLNGQTQPLS